MRDFNLVLLCCLVLFECSWALRRIKRTSTADASSRLGESSLNVSLGNAMSVVERPVVGTSREKDTPRDKSSTIAEMSQSSLHQGIQRQHNQLRHTSTGSLSNRNNQKITTFHSDSAVTEEASGRNPLAFLVRKEEPNMTHQSGTELKNPYAGGIADVVIIDNGLRHSVGEKDLLRQNEHFIASSEPVHTGMARKAETLSAHDIGALTAANNTGQPDMRHEVKVVQNGFCSSDNGAHKKRNKDDMDSKLQQQTKKPVTLLTRSSTKRDGGKQFSQQHIIAKLAPMADVLKVANMLLYRIGLGESYAPMRTQGSQMLFSPSPNAGAVIGPMSESGDDLDAVDYFYNALDSKPIVRSSGLPRMGSTTLVQRIQQQQPYVVNETPLPFNFIEGALDMLLASGDDDDESEIELRCPIHHEFRKRLPTDGVGEGTEQGGKDDLIQVCSCRLIKKKTI